MATADFNCIVLIISHLKRFSESFGGGIWSAPVHYPKLLLRDLFVVILARSKQPKAPVNNFGQIGISH
jgi:hypothetical protein